ncbi:MAG: HAD-IC family P-type ATPase, partial [Nitrolancea sp.]
KGALIQRTNAVESMSHLDILCMDKTGTLTTNRLELAEVVPTAETTETRLRELLGIYAASTEGGNRTIDAIRTACNGLPHAQTGEVPFSSERKWSAISFSDELNGSYILGAPEMILPHVKAAGDVSTQLDEWTHQGLRALIFARANGNTHLGSGSGNPALPNGLELLGAINFRDELRAEAQATIQGFTALGIKMKIISGDNPETVAALARQAGIDGSARAISGLQLDGLNELEFQEVADDVTVFGRVTPQQKERLIRSMRESGHYVAMIGDGVNDILALKQSQLAIAMRSGSQATRSIADLVLLDDSYAVLPDLFKEGQRILSGMQDIIRLFLVRTLAVAFIVFGTALTGERFPIMPQHNALLALLTVGIPAFALAVWAKPGTPVKRLLHIAAPFVVPASVSIAIVAVSIYALYASLTNDVTLARTALTTSTVFCGILLIPFLEPPTEAWTGGNDLNGDWRPTILAGVMFALFAVVMFVPFLRHFYQLEALGPADMIVIGLMVVGWASALRFIWRLKPFDRSTQLWHRARGRLRRNPE